MSVPVTAGGDLLEPPHQRPVLLDAYAARTCPVKTHNAFDPTVTIPPVESGARLTELFDGASEFEAVVLEELITSCRGRVVDLRLLAEHPSTERTEACLAAMASGAAVIIAGLLPVDGPGHRVGRPDLLVRGADAPTGRPAYHPVAVKWHKIIERARPPPPFEGAGRAGGGLLHPPDRPAPRRRPGLAGPHPSAGQPSRRLPPARALPSDAAGLWLRGRPGPRCSDRHRWSRSRSGAGLGRPRPTVGADVFPQPS